MKKYKLKYQRGGKTQGKQPTTFSGRPQVVKSYAQEYQEGGTINPNQILASFLETLTENEQSQFIDEFQDLSPEEQLEVIQAITQKLNPTQPQMQEGGELDYIPVEVEGKETVKLPDGELQRFEGPSHAEGGIPTILPEGSKIYSEHLKAPPEVVEVVLGKKTKKKYSYADLSKKFPTKPFEDKLQDPALDKFEKQAAAIKLENHKTMLETIFEAQEMDKAKSKPQQMLTAQQGGKVTDLYPRAKMTSTEGYDMSEYSNRFKAIDKPNTYYDPETKKYFYRTESGLYRESLKQGTPPVYKKPQESLTPQQWSEIGWRPGAKIPNSDVVVKGQPMNKDAKKYVTSFVDEFGQPNIFPVGKQPSDYPTDANSFDDYNNVIEQIEPIQQPPAKGKPKVKVPSKAQPRTIDNLTPLSGVPLPSFIPGGRNFADEVLTSLWKWEESEPSDTTKNFAQEDQPVDDQSYPGRDPWWKDLGISRQLSGTIFDSLMAASNRLNVDEPQYRDNRKYPLFTRFVDFEDKEVSKQYNLAMQQIMNSNMPEQVKQSQIANLNAKLQDYQGKQDLQRNQLYQQKLMGDTEKLQMYMDRNIDQATADLENYRMKKARIEDLKNQFKAKRKADIINPIRKYLDFVQEVDLQNQVYADNFAMNPWTGKVKFTKSTPDPLKKQEELMSQFPSGSMSRNIDGGGRLITLPGGIMLYEDPSGKTIELTGRNEPQEDDGKAAAKELMNRKL